MLYEFLDRDDSKRFGHVIWGVNMLSCLNMFTSTKAEELQQFTGSGFNRDWIPVASQVLARQTRMKWWLEKGAGDICMLIDRALA